MLRPRCLALAAHAAAALATATATALAAAATLATALAAAAALGYALAVKNLYTMNVEFYTGVDERLPVPMILPPVPDLVELRFARVLIVDDVADTGHTLKIVQDFFKGRVKEVRSAVLYEKSHSVVQCEYVWKHTDLWINFPWSDKDPVVKRSGIVKDA